MSATTAPRATTAPALGFVVALVLAALVGLSAGIALDLQIGTATVAPGQAAGETTDNRGGTAPLDFPASRQFVTNQPQLE